MLSSPSTSKTTVFRTIMHIDPLACDAYKEAYTKYEDFNEVFQQL